MKPLENSHIMGITERKRVCAFGKNGEKEGAAMLEKIDLSKKADKETCRQVMEQEGERLARLQRECKGRRAFR